MNRRGEEKGCGCDDYWSFPSGSGSLFPGSLAVTYVCRDAIRPRGMVLMTVVTTILVAFAGLTLFGIGVLTGIWMGNSRQEKDPNFKEAVKLWQSMTKQIEELSHHNVVGLGSLRERIEKMSFSTRDDQLLQLIDVLIEGNRRSHRRAKCLESNQSAKRPRHEFPRHRTFDNEAQLGTSEQEDLSIEALLEAIYGDLQKVIPFQRMGYAEIDSNQVTAVWCRSDRPVKLAAGYSARLSESSLRFVAERKCPRILNDLEAYLKRHPTSHSTRLLVLEGFRSSITAPVCANGEAVAFLFLTSIETNAFNEEQVTFVKKAAELLGQRIAASLCET